VTIRLLYLVSHPIQYQAPLLRLIAAEPGLSLKVVFERDFSSRRYHDSGFGVDVEWDVPLRDGYDSALAAETDVAAAIHDADAIWLHGWESALMRSVLARAHTAGRPILMRGENWSGAMPYGMPPRSWLKRLYLARIFSRCRAFLAIGSRNRAYYEDCGIEPSRIFDMPYAIDNEFFARRATPEAVAEVRVRHDIARARKILLYAGKLTQRKHADHLLAAWRNAPWPEGARPILLIVGDGELRGQLEREAGPDVIFAGFRNQSEMPAYYAAADLFALPAEREPWGLAINEAMACGTGIIATDQVGAAYDLVGTDTGIRIAAGDVTGLARALPDLMARSDALGCAAKARIANWDFRADIAGLRAALDAVVGR
jgi:glycosyltransferase involved in cell wall biosynthesis